MVVSVGAFRRIFHRLAQTGRSLGAARLSNIQMQRRVAGVLFLVTLGAILVAGLWPFCAPTNDVSWVRDGIRFGSHGTALSTGNLGSAGLDDETCGLEVWLQPARTWATGSILAFYNSSKMRQVVLEQDYTDLVLYRSVAAWDGVVSQSSLRVPNVFRRQQAFIAITAAGQGTSIYIDGQWVLTSPDFRLSAQDLSGQLILANSPFRDHSWSGQMKRLGIYEGELSAPQVVRHYREWPLRGEPSGGSERALALYLFHEQGGSIIHNAVSGGMDLRIPKRFLVLHQMLFESPLTEVHTERSYGKNALINVAGFVPLGFVASFYFAAFWKMARAAMAAILVGAATSFAIEYFQSYLPTRYSGLTDTITNTLGAGLGAMLYCATAGLVTYISQAGRSNTQSG